MAKVVTVLALLIGAIISPAAPEIGASSPNGPVVQPHAVISRAHASATGGPTALPHAPSTGLVWEPGSTVDIGAGVASDWIDAASCWAPGDCLGVGSTAEGDNGQSAATLFTNGVASVAPTPPLAFDTYSWGLGSISCVSASFCMLANGGSNPTPSTVFYLFNGAAWQAESSPALSPGSNLNAVSCTSALFCVAEGWTSASAPEVDEFNGTSWSSVSLPALPPSTTATLPRGISCAGTFCMLGPVAEGSTGDLWMAVLSGGTWSDTEIDSVSASGPTTLQGEAVSCPTAGMCMVGIQASGSTGGFVPYESGTWGALTPVAQDPQGSGNGDPEAEPSLWCTSMVNCVAAVTFAGDSALEQFDGAQWIALPGTSTPGGESDPEWRSVSCPTIASCLATSWADFAFETAPLSTSTSVSAQQTGPEDVTATATAAWSELSTKGPQPDAVTYYYYGQPIDGCTDVPIPDDSFSPVTVPGCDVLFDGGGSYGFSASVDPTTYFEGSLSATASGTLEDGYWEAGADGSVYPFGSAQWYGDASGSPLQAPVVGMALTSDDLGYWLVASDGGIFNYGDAPFYGSTGSIHLNQPIVGMAATSDGGGYWLVASDGGIFSYGDAEFYGSTGSIHLNKPIVGMAATPDGNGYWLVASDGGIFSYGDAQFYGSTGSVHLNKPIVGMTPTPDGNGYWLVASDGGIFSYGDAEFYGSTGSIHLDQPIVGMAPTFDDGGYWMAAADGGIFNYGDAGFHGSEGGQTIPGPVVAIEPA